MICPPLDSERLYAAIPSRFSTRIYDGVALRDTEEFRAMCDKVNCFDDARVVFVERVPEGFFKGIIGSYYKLENAPSALVCVVDTASPTGLFHMGYLGELLVLEATARGIDSCWVAGSFSREVAGNQVQLGEGEQVVAAIALGYGTEPAKERKRKDIDVIGVGSGDWPAWAFKGLAAAQIAPSAMNMQPWRFSYDASSGEVAVGAVTRLRFLARAPMLDCGIAASHFELGAAHEKVYGIWESSTSKRCVFRPVNPVISGAKVAQTASASKHGLRTAPAGVNATPTPSPSDSVNG